MTTAPTPGRWFRLSNGCGTYFIHGFATMGTTGERFAIVASWGETMWLKPAAEMVGEAVGFWPPPFHPAEGEKSEPAVA